MKIIAHRGVYDNVNVVENTIKSFSLARDKGYDIELDVCLTKDKKLVVFHDNNMKRLLGVDKKIGDVSYDEISNKKLLNTNSNIPLFIDVLKCIDGKVPIYIEVKANTDVLEICDILYEEIKEYKGTYFIQSFNYKVIKYFKDKGIKSGLIITGLKTSYYYKSYFLLYFIIKYISPDFLSVSKRCKFLIKRYKNRYPLLIWTIKDINKITDDSFGYVCDNLLNKKNS